MDIIGQSLRQFCVGIELAVLMAAPGTGMHLIDVDGPAMAKVLPLGHPAGIVPGIVFHGSHHRFGAWLCCGARSIGIHLEQCVPIGSDHTILISRTCRQPGDKALPDPLVIDPTHFGSLRIPAVEIPHHRNTGGIGRPHPEGDPFLSGALPGLMCTKVGIGSGLGPTVEPIQKGCILF